MSDRPGYFPFGNWTAIFVEYCDGTSYTGDHQDPVVIGKEKMSVAARSPPQASDYPSWRVKVYNVK